MMVDEGLDPMCILVQPFVGDCSLAGFIMAKTPTKKNIANHFEIVFEI